MTELELAADATPPVGLWERMRADPVYAPEYLALEAVRIIGPRAVAWVEYVRTVQPHLSPDDLATVAAKKFANIAALSGAVSGAAGLPGAVVDFGVLAWNQSRLVLHVAAAYGVDPRDPERATDLLVLQQVHGAVEAARTALGVASGRASVGAAAAKLGGGKALGRLTVRLAKMAGMRAVKRLGAKVIPGAAIIFGSWANRAAAKDLAARAIAHYRTAALGPVPPQRLSS